MNIYVDVTVRKTKKLIARHSFLQLGTAKNYAERVKNHLDGAYNAEVYTSESDKPCFDITDSDE